MIEFSQSDTLYYIDLIHAFVCYIKLNSRTNYLFKEDDESAYNTQTFSIPAVLLTTKLLHTYRLLLCLFSTIQ